jgi:hypothetical protein
VDPAVIRERKAAVGKSHVNDGACYPTVRESTMRAGTVAHPGFVPPEMAEKTAFQSHHDFRNCDGRPSTTYRDAFPKRPYEHVPAVDHHLQDSHASFGNDQINEKRTLYNDSYQRPPQTRERIDMQAARDFHQAHHLNNRGLPGDKTGITTYRDAYRGCPGGKASDICEALRGGHNIVPNDPRFAVKKSAMREAYVPYPKAPLPQPVDNSLQRSHIQMQGTDARYSTTQSDYFWWHLYRLPHEAKGKPYY